MFADVGPTCFEVLTDHAILVQVNGICSTENGPQVQDDGEDIAQQKVSAIEVSKHLRALQRY